jgi:RNA polymerase sigma-70 factor (ECF subfamily)
MDLPAAPIAVTDPDAADLLAWRQSGDRLALAALWERHAPTAWRIALRICGQPAAAQDAVHEAALRLMQRSGTWNGSGPVRPWLLAIVATAARDAQRHSARRERREQPLDPVVHRSGPEREDHSDVAAALAALPDHERIPVALRYLDGLGFTEIAAVLGARERTIRSRVGRGLERLRALLGAPPRRTTAVMAALVAHGALPAAIPPVPVVSWPAVTTGTMATATATGTVITVVAASVAAATAVAVLALAPAPSPVTSPAPVIAADPRPVGDPATAAVLPAWWGMERSTVFRGQTVSEARYAILGPDRPLAVPRVLHDQPAGGIHGESATVGGALDRVAAAVGGRVRVGSRVVAIDRADAQTEGRIAIWRSARTRDELEAAAWALARSADQDGVRALLRDIGEPGERGAVALAAIPLDDMEASPWALWADDTAVRAAWRRAPGWSLTMPADPAWQDDALLHRLVSLGRWLAEPEDVPRRIPPGRTMRCCTGWSAWAAGWRSRRMCPGCGPWPGPR